jgi:hypothetical protein
MNDLIKQLDTLLKPINDAVHNSLPPAQIIRYTAFYCLITGIINFCVSIGLVTAGLFGGAAAAFSSATAGTTAEGQQAVAALGAVSGLALISGVLYLIAAPFLLIVAFGLYRRMGWARMGAVLVLAVTAVIALLRLFSGDIFNIIWLLADLYLAYFFYTDSGIKREFGQV